MLTELIGDGEATRAGREGSHHQFLRLEGRSIGNAVITRAQELGGSSVS